MPLGCLPVLIVLGFMLLLPFFLMNVVLAALVKLGFSPNAGLYTMIGVFLGSMVNIPLKRLPRDEDYETRPFAAFGLDRFFRISYSRRDMTVAVNVGGCVIPCLIVVYEWQQILHQSPQVLVAVLAASLLNIIVCYKIARPVPQVGIALPALVPALIAALSALVMAPSMAPPVAFIAGVLGPLIGADLMHLTDIKELQTGMVSIGGAGTFDGIVLSGIIAVLLA